MHRLHGIMEGSGLIDVEEIGNDMGSNPSNQNGVLVNVFTDVDQELLDFLTEGPSYCRSCHLYNVVVTHVVQGQHGIVQPGLSG